MAKYGETRACRNYVATLAGLVNEEKKIDEIRADFK